MVSDWNEDILSNIAEIIDSRHKTPVYSDSGYPMVRVVDVNGGALNLENTKRVSDEVYEDFSRGRDPEVGDLVISRVGSYGVVSYVNSDEKFCLGQNTAFIIPKINSRFLYYQLISPFVKWQIEQFVVGAVQKTISLKSIRQFQIKLPPEPEQKAIAHILGSLDDKIELNRQMNETLEAMAQALFKSWFVDFDPVIDNALAAGNAIPDELLERAEQRKGFEKKDNSDIQGLFPDEFEFTEEMGWIPKGWGVGALDNMFELQRGFDLPKTKRTDGLYPLMAASGQDGTHYEYKVKGPGVITGRSGKLGVVSFVNANYWPLNTTLWVKNYNQSNPYHAYFFLQTLDLEKYNSGSAVLSLNRNNVHNLVQILPSKIVLDKFQEVVKSSFAKIAENNTGIETLAKLRDTLLPKLMSGEVRISDAAELVDEVL